MTATNICYNFVGFRLRQVTQTHSYFYVNVQEIYSPIHAMHGNTNFSIQLHSEGSLCPPIYIYIYFFFLTSTEHGV